MELAQAIAQAQKSEESIEIPLEDSGWLAEKSPREIKQITGDFKKRYQQHLEQATLLLGEPTHVTSKSDEAPEWYLEALSLAAWAGEGRTLFLALVHHDEDTPVALIFGSFTDEEIRERCE